MIKQERLSISASYDEMSLFNNFQIFFWNTTWTYSF